MANSFIPAQDASSLIWMEAFASGIQADAGKYFLTSDDANAISAAVLAFSDALAICTTPPTRSPVSVAEKNDSRIAAEQICRQYASLIKPNAGISDPDKIAIGVRPVNPDRQPINAPTSSPLLNIIAATPGAQTVRYADSMTPATPAKPYAAQNLQLFVSISDTEASDPDAATFVGAYTKNPIGVAFTAANDQKIATYFARWASRKGDVGPWSLPISMTIAA